MRGRVATAHHERHGLLGHAVGCHDEVALVLPVRVVRHDDELAGGDVRQRICSIRRTQLLRSLAPCSYIHTVHGASHAWTDGILYADLVSNFSNQQLLRCPPGMLLKPAVGGRPCASHATGRCGASSTARRTLLCCLEARWRWAAACAPRRAPLHLCLLCGRAADGRVCCSRLCWGQWMMPVSPIACCIAAGSLHF